MTEPIHHIQLILGLKNRDAFIKLFRDKLEAKFNILNFPVGSLSQPYGLIDLVQQGPDENGFVKFDCIGRYVIRSGENGYGFDIGLLIRFQLIPSGGDRDVLVGEFYETRMGSRFFDLLKEIAPLYEVSDQLQAQMLNRVELGVLDAYKTLLEERVKITNGTISARMMEHGVYNERSGLPYSDEHISRTRSSLRQKGLKFDLD